MPETNDIRYGLYWKKPKKEEKVVLKCQKEWPILKEVKGKGLKKEETGSDQADLFDYDPNIKVKSPTHLLIEGDNYHALAALNFTHRGKIDVIVIDPPYNTGNKDFMYNDCWVDKEDSERHSKWLSFMSRRLPLARDLLSDTGLIFIHIDDNEFAQLKLLCDKVFGEDNVEVMIWEKVGDGYTGAGKMKMTKRFRTDHEYIITCYKDKIKTKFGKVNELPNFKAKGNNLDNDPRGNYISGIMSMNEEKSSSKSKNFYTMVSPSGKKTTRQWHFSKEKFEELANDNRIYWGKTGDGVPMQKVFINLEREIVAPSIIRNKGSLTSAKRELDGVLGSKLEGFTPKPLLLIKYLINLIQNKSSIILDFFAGSGTTGVAVLQLNRKDGGNRQFILCTNNESKICTNVCYPRIKKAMEGYVTSGGKKIEGMGGSLKYYKVAFEKASTNGDQAVFNIARNCRDILRTSEQIHNLMLGDLDGGKYWDIFQQENRYMGIYYNMLDRNSWNELRDTMNNIKGERILYYFSLSREGLSSEEFEGWDENIEKKPISHKLIGRYKTIFKKK